MRIAKVFNNNLIVVLLANGEEVILSGPGLGFQQKPGNVVKEELIKKKYYIQSEQTQKIHQLLERMPYEYLNLAEEIFEYVGATYGKVTGEMAFIALADHIAFAVERQRQQIELPNLLLSPTKLLYPDEYQLGLRAVTLINERLNVNLDANEAGFIAIHIINSTTEALKSNAREIMEFTQNTVKIIEDVFQCRISADSFDYQRLLMHLKHFSLRLVQEMEEEIDSSLNDIYQILVSQDTRIEAFLTVMRAYVKDFFGKEMTESECTYLLVHVNRIIKKLKSE